MTLQQKLVKHCISDGYNFIPESVYIEVWDVIQQHIEDYQDADIWRMQTDLFNQNDYIIYYDDGQHWLKKHSPLNVFDLMEVTDDKSMSHFGEPARKPKDCATCINDFIYWISYDLFAVISTEFEGINENITDEIINKVLEAKFK